MAKCWAVMTKVKVLQSDWQVSGARLFRLTVSWLHCGSPALHWLPVTPHGHCGIALANAIAALHCSVQLYFCTPSDVEQRSATHQWLHWKGSDPMIVDFLGYTHKQRFVVTRPNPAYVWQSLVWDPWVIIQYRRVYFGVFWTPSLAPLVLSSDWIFFIKCGYRLSQSRGAPTDQGRVVI